ncbi:hypothetical protein [Rhodoferax mekongensis]|uniref:hypothetical protein n=1 Tax=Rhodoferax mekongensis TaxID=3068341 RepID=UPI0028BE97D0|nr:hypothetical protein [Rhodoferax sp. TBRC 17199]MDT7514404.1 hypothetical protein [Rhodoferax sp. TBRC 17199]
MLHYVLHAGSVPWRDQLLYAGLIIAVIAAVFFGLWWRKRASRPQQGDFAALVQQGNVVEALEAQAQSPLADAADAWQETRHTMENVKTGVERFLALILSLLSGLLCLISVLAVFSDLWHFPPSDWGTFAFYMVLGGVTAWFTRVKWRDFRGRK